eukprot:m.285377 g.285377  ORF g.285377 m.285377 type:complete len:207 (+) comp11362_c0_seq1:5661-6281(+)
MARGGALISVVLLFDCFIFPFLFVSMPRRSWCTLVCVAPGQATSLSLRRSGDIVLVRSFCFLCFFFFFPLSTDWIAFLWVVVSRSALAAHSERSNALLQRTPGVCTSCAMLPARGACVLLQMLRSEQATGVQSRFSPRAFSRSTMQPALLAASLLELHCLPFVFRFVLFLVLCRPNPLLPRASAWHDWSRLDASVRMYWVIFRWFL